MAHALHGKNLIGNDRSAASSVTLRARNPLTGQDLDPPFYEATPEEIDRAAGAALEAAAAMRLHSAEERADLLDRMADAVESMGDDLVERVMIETALPEGRVRGERGRTTGQLRMFAELVREGSWVDARIERPQPDRKPAPKPDIRRMLIPIGPVAVFGASNFPLAFSVAGGDTASAIAAGCPVVVKAHPAHPGTSEFVGEALAKAVREAGFHPGTFSMVHAARPETSLSLVRHPAVKAVGFTGSLVAGRAIFDAAASRPEPIPVHAEMGSVNPVFVLPGALRERGEQIVDGLIGSVTLGGGQFCTNPGVVVGLGNGDLESFIGKVGERAADTSPCTLLHQGIQQGYEKGLSDLEAVEDVRPVARSASGDGAGGRQGPGSRAGEGSRARAGADGDPSGGGGPGAGSGANATPASTAVFSAPASAFLKHERLREEVFGPSTLIVSCTGSDEMARVAESLTGNLTATIHGTAEDLEEFADLVRSLEKKVGRLIFNGFPTGVEVCAAMHHGGPYPATTDARSTSVGTAAIFRFARPVCYQDFPQHTLPPELRDKNERGIWRMIDGALSREEL